MSKFLLNSLIAATAFAGSVFAAHAADAEAGEAVFNKCKACHAVGEGAKNKVGPELNNLFGRSAGSVDGFKYSNAMMESGIVWQQDTLAEYLAAPRTYVKGTKMAFAGLKKDEDIENVLAYLATFSEGAGENGDAAAVEANEAPKTDVAAAAAATPAATEAAGAADAVTETASYGEASKGKFGLGRQANDAEIAAWDVKIMPDGAGLPEGSGSVADGENLFSEKCAACHGEFAEGVDNWPKLAGGEDTLADKDPVKTVGSYWPYLSTVWDYAHRSMPFGEAQSMTADETYAIVAYILYSNYIVEEDFVLSRDNFADVEMPNADNFIVDDRAETEYPKWSGEPCMENCKEDVKITMRATVLDVTPDAEPEGGGASVE